MLAAEVNDALKVERYINYHACCNMMGFVNKDFRDIFMSQIVSLLVGLLAGTLLAVLAHRILLIPGIFIILPGFLGMRGNISGTFASRLSSGLFLKVINPKKTNTTIIKGNLWASFSLVVFVSLALGIIAFFFNLLVFHLSTPKIIVLPLLAGIIANAIEIPTTLFATMYLFRKGHDPDNIMGPFVTSTGDVTSIISLLIALVLL